MELSNSLVCSGDDFILANLVLLKGPMRCFKDAPIRYSNRLILEDLLKSNNVSDTTKKMLDDIVALENFPKEYIGIAIQSKRTDLLELVPQILLPSEVEYCDNYKYEQLAEATGEPVVIECVNQLNKVVYEMVESYFIREQARHQFTRPPGHKLF